MLSALLSLIKLVPLVTKLVDLVAHLIKRYESHKASKAKDAANARVDDNINRVLSEQQNTNSGQANGTPGVSSSSESGS